MNQPWIYMCSPSTCNGCFWTVVLEKTLESPLDCKDIKSVNPKGNQPCIFMKRTDTEVKLQFFGHLMQRTDSLEKTLMLEKTEGKEREAEDEMVKYHYWLSGHEFELTLGDHGRQRDLACWSPSEVRHDLTLKNNKKKIIQKDLFKEQKQMHRLRKWFFGYQGKG